MACVRKRRGKWVADYRDAEGTRRWITCNTRRLAELALSKALQASQQPTHSVVNPDIRVAEYATCWLELIAATIAPRTLESYHDNLRLHILPKCGKFKLSKLTRSHIKRLLTAKLEGGLSRNTVRIIHATLRAMLNAAIDDGVILINPAARLGRQLRLVTPAKARQELIKAMTREERNLFLSTALKKTPRYYPLFATLVGTGIRLGESRALRLDDLHLAKREIRVVQALSAGQIKMPKSGHGRTVDISHVLATTLAKLLTARKAQTLRRGWKELPPWVFCSAARTPIQETLIRKAFSRILKAAGLPRHFTPHCLRHTYATLLLQQGTSIAYVQRQLGHASIQLTVDTYGKWLPIHDKTAIDLLDSKSGSKMVATGQDEAEDNYVSS